KADWLAVTCHAGCCGKNSVTEICEPGPARLIKLRVYATRERNNYVVIVKQVSYKRHTSLRFGRDRYLKVHIEIADVHGIDAVRVKCAECWSTSSWYLTDAQRAKEQRPKDE